MADADAGNGIRRIAVGVDGSEGSLAALAWALDEARIRGAEVDAVLAYTTDLAWIDVGSDAAALFVERAAISARDALHGILASLPDPSPVVVRPLVVEGAPAAALAEVARTAELLVVGARGRGGFTGLLLGSVSQRCAENAPCPVVVIPTGARR
jgi:nucleotide-binding universal stress UspA family protein